MTTVFALLSADLLGKPAWMWAAFIGVVVALLVADLGLFHRQQREIGIRESFALSGLYIAIGLAFGAVVWYALGSASGMEYLTGFAIEKALALDNVFVIALIFGYFSVPLKYQHRVLFWGILGVIVLRALMIGAGAAIIANFSWVLALFAVFLILTGVKMLLVSDKSYDVASNPVLRLLRRAFHVTDTHHGERFFVQGFDANGRQVRYATPLFLALVMIEFADIIFAVDSVPAIFAITKDPFIVYTSNIFAILGLRALYFALAAMVDRFHYLKTALAFVLIFIGGKVLVADFLGIDKVPAALSLGVTLAILAAGVLVSLFKKPPQANRA